MERNLEDCKTRGIHVDPAERDFSPRQFSVFSPFRRPRHGFTLVELLVVMAVIGILLALLIPAINAIREDAKQTKCLNNQREIGQAIMHFESAKNHLPGVVNKPQGGLGLRTPGSRHSCLTWTAATCGARLARVVPHRLPRCDWRLRFAPMIPIPATPRR